MKITEVFFDMLAKKINKLVDILHVTSHYWVFLMTEFLPKKNKDGSSGRRDLKARTNQSLHILLLDDAQG